MYKRLQMWRHNDVIGRNEYLISILSESTVPWVYSLKFLFKSTHHLWRYKRKCEWVFFSEHSVELNPGSRHYLCNPARNRNRILFILQTRAHTSLPTTNELGEEYKRDCLDTSNMQVSCDDSTMFRRRSTHSQRTNTQLGSTYHHRQEQETVWQTLVESGLKHT